MYKGNKCPDTTKPDVVPYEQCLHCARNRVDRRCPYPSFLIGEIATNEVNLRDRISPTTLHACMRQLALKRAYDYYIDPGHYWVMVRGNTIHKYVSSLPPEEGHIREETQTVEIHLGEGIKAQTVIMEGTPDEYIPHAGHLLDYKTVKYISHFMTDVNDPKFEWTAQLSCYRWILAQKGIVINTAEIVLVGPEEIARVPYRMWDLDYTEEYIKDRVAKLLMVYTMGWIPPVLEPEDQWKCIKCESRNSCENVALMREEMPPDPEGRPKKRGR